VSFIATTAVPLLSFLFLSKLRAAVARSQELEQERHGIRRNQFSPGLLPSCFL